ncbi:MAG: acyl-[ACP]--phospholipid O-acyltransferase [Gammaproteobacteria bacterium]|nr:acyl-[ACP]--phospholipid O-acyltransferase [Gammaproteobacteria bacterium]
MSLLRRIAGFTPYLIVVFLNAFVDLGHKIVIQNTVFKTYSGQEQVVLTAIVNGLILLPFVFLFSPAGFLSDRFAKQRIIRHAALAAVGATLAITYCYYQGWFWGAFLLTLALAVQSAIYSPAKYGYIKELAGQQNLASANGAVQAITIAGILLGTLVFSYAFELLLIDQGALSSGETLAAIAPIGWVLVALALLEWLFTFRLPRRKEGDPARHFELQPYLRLDYLKRNLQVISHDTAIKLSIVGLATFWAISQVLLAAFPAFAKETLFITNTVVIQGVLACSGIGIAIGSMIAGRVSRNYIETGLLPVAAAGITLGILCLPALQSALAMALAFMLVGVMGGMFIVPLNSIIQFHAPESRLGTILAGNNWVQNVAMLAALGLTVTFALAGINSVGLFYILSLVALVGTGYTLRKLPHSFARILATAILKRRYKVAVVGFENLPRSGATLLLGNHISWIDWALVQIACPRPIRFVMLKRIYELWYLKPFFKLFGVVPIAAGQSRESIETINALLQRGECVCLFPEGAISRNGHLGKFHSGYERMVEGVSDGVIIPFYLHGLWGSSFSRAEEGLRDARAPSTRRDLIVAFGKALPLSTPAEQLKQKVFELSISAWDGYTAALEPLPLAVLRTAHRQPGAVAAINSTGEKLTYRQFAAATACFAGAIENACREDNVGILLPASSAAAIATVAVNLRGKVAVHLNYTAGAVAVHSAIASAGVKSVLTSRLFITRLAERGIDVDQLLPAEVERVILEDVREQLPKWKLVTAALLHTALPARWFYRLYGRSVDIESPAAILFSSGSESAPKGIVLSHRNIMCNSKQISDVLNTQVNDVMMSCLPPFHSFGLTVTTLLPLIEGIPMICHPDPTDSLGVARAVARYQATLLLGTSTFLSFYARNKKVHPLMLDSLRVVVSGAEKLSDRVRDEFEHKFRKTIYEGYGATETTPVASVNIPDAMDTTDWKIQEGNVKGTVGMPLPGTSFRIVDPETFAELPLGEDGLILISGQQVMLGYLNDEERTAEVIRELDGLRWYVSGDKGHLTPSGFLVIVDRYSRFAKIAGEMVSLSSVEQVLLEALGDAEIDIAATALPDARKGEKVVLLVSGDEAQRDIVKEAITAAEINPLMRPAEIYAVAEIPRLGSGKLDLSRLRQLALQQAAA